jgi:hypothetical protein
MKLKLLFATAASALAVVGSAAGDGGRLARYAFAGTLNATPAAGATSLSVHVQGGNKLALRKMLGASEDQSFAVDSNTEFLRWSEGIPFVVSIDKLQAGDKVTVRIRAPRSASLADVEAKAANVVADRGPNPGRPDKPLYLFRGTLSAVGSSTLTVDVKGGNRRALRLLIGQSASQSFAYDSSTIFLLWQGKVPTQIQASQLKAGDPITVRIRAPKGSSLAQVEATPAKHVGEHEPASK